MIDNPDFVEAGATPGTALRWTLRTHVAREAIAAFDRRGEETFEAWSVFEVDFDRVVADRDFFGLAGTDDFDWPLRTFVDQLEPTMTVPTVFGTSVTERFVWSPLLDGSTAVAVADGFADDLERDWRNDTFTSELDVAHASPAFFDLGPAAETFDVGWPALTRS